jgi:hypothetical protein
MKLRLFRMLLLALPVSAFGQTYLYNQAVIGTGKSPVAVVASSPGLVFSVPVQSSQHQERAGRMPRLPNRA